MGRILYFSLLVVLVAIYAATFGQELTPVQGICVLSRQTPGIFDVFTVPFGAQHTKEIVWRKTAPDDFHAVLALMQVVSVAPCGIPSNQEARLLIRAIRLIERDPITGTEEVVSEVNDFQSNTGAFRFDGELFPRTPSWYQGSAFEPAPDMLESGKILTIDLAKMPRFIYHGWTDPKVEARPGKNYLVEMEVNIEGQARLQMGIDYWREKDSAYNTFDEKCQQSNNCEGYLSRWFGTSDGWQTIRTPDSL